MVHFIFSVCVFQNIEYFGLSEADYFDGSNFGTILELQRSVKIQPDKILTSLFVQQFHLLSMYMLFERFMGWSHMVKFPLCVRAHVGYDSNVLIMIITSTGQFVNVGIHIF